MPKVLNSDYNVMMPLTDGGLQYLLATWFSIREFPAAQGGLVGRVFLENETEMQRIGGMNTDDIDSYK